MNTLVGAGFVLATEQMAPRLFDLDLQLIADASLMIIAVFALFLIASKLLFNPVRDMMQKRQEKIKGELDIVVASMMASKVVNSSIDATVRDSLIDETLKEIGESTWLS